MNRSSRSISRRLVFLAGLSMVVLFIAGCGQSPASLAPRKYVKQLPPTDPIQFGQQVYMRYGCALCHGNDGKSGITNANAKTAEQIPGVVYVSEGYTPEELKQFVRRGQPLIDKLKPDGPTPPYKMPVYAGWISEPELDALQKYLFSLMPKGEAEKF